MRETRPVVNLALFLLANTGQPFSAQRLTKVLAIPSVPQTLRYLEYLQDAYALFAPPNSGRPSSNASSRLRNTTPSTTGCDWPPRPRTVRTRVLGWKTSSTSLFAAEDNSLYYAGETERWECDFVTPSEAIQVCLELTQSNLEREAEGVTQAPTAPIVPGRLSGHSQRKRDRLRHRSRRQRVPDGQESTNGQPADPRHPELVRRAEGTSPGSVGHRVALNHLSDCWSILFQVGLRTLGHGGVTTPSANSPVP